VSYSNGIGDANRFIGTGGRGLSIELAVNRDPVGGMAIGGKVGARKQYLSGVTGGGRPRPGFDFLPLPRWKHEPFFKVIGKFSAKYLHDWCIPQYTLHLGLL
jgi:hypothetical protein